MHEELQESVEAFKELLAVLKRLRAPGGCPWDRKQTEKTMAPSLLEEAYEAADAIADGEDGRMAEELGDLGMNLLMICLIAEERRAFDVAAVFRKIAAKLKHRHPHVFQASDTIGVDRVLRQWEDLKRKERREKREDTSAVAGIPGAMPSLLRAVRLVEKMRRTGAALEFLEETDSRCRPLLDALSSGRHPGMDAVTEAAAGALLFSAALLCLEGKINPEMALRAHLRNLERSFRVLEARLGERLADAPRTEVETIWKKAADS